LTFDDEVFAWVRDALHASLAGEKREHEAAIGWLTAEYESKAERFTASKCCPVCP
jgi:hypothetical protein